MERTSMGSTERPTGRTADRQSGRTMQRAVSTQISYCYEVEVTAIPAWCRRKLPTSARLCYVSEPEWRDGDDDMDWCLVRVAATRDRLASARPLWLCAEEAAVLYRALDAVTVAPQPEIVALPVALLSAHLAETDHRPPVVSVEALRSELPADLVQAMLARPTAQADGEAMLPLGEVWAVQSTGLRDDAGHVQVQATAIPERLEGRATGSVFTAWIDEHVLSAAPVYDHALRAGDSFQRRAQVAAQVTAQGVTIPLPEPEPAHEVAVTMTELAETCQLVPCKDPVHLWKEDVLAAKGNPEIIVERAIARLVEQEQAEPDTPRREKLAVLRGWCEEALIWYTSLPRKQRPRDFVSLSPLVVPVAEPVRTPTGKVRTHHSQPVLREVPTLLGYQLVVGVPLTLLDPWRKWIGDALVLPTPTAQRGQPVLRHVPASARRARRWTARDLSRLLAPVATALTEAAGRVIRRYRVLADGTRQLVATLPMLVSPQEVSVA